MTLMQQASALMAEVGPVSDFLAIAEYEQQAMWRVLVEEGNELVVELDPPMRQLVVTADIAVPAGGDLLPLYRMLLQYSRQWSATGGIHMALETDGMVVAVFRLGIDGLERTVLAGVLRRFADTVAAWRGIIGEYGRRSASQAHKGDLGLVGEGAIRI